MIHQNDEKKTFLFTSIVYEVKARSNSPNTRYKQITIHTLQVRGPANNKNGPNM
jgi:hypothetical protein